MSDLTVKLAKIIVAGALLSALGCATSNKNTEPYKKAVRSSFEHTLPGIRGCYEETLRETPDLSGVLTLKWTITPSGRVIEAEVSKKDFESPKLEKCVLGQLKAARFPSAPPGQVMVISYPVHFDVGRATLF